MDGGRKKNLARVFGRGEKKTLCISMSLLLLRLRLSKNSVLITPANVVCMRQAPTGAQKLCNLSTFRASAHD